MPPVFLPKKYICLSPWTHKEKLAQLRKKPKCRLNSRKPVMQDIPSHASDWFIAWVLALAILNILGYKGELVFERSAWK